jgi:hypothetical protein
MAADPVTGGLAVADDLLKVGLQKDAQANTPAMEAAKVARELQALKDKIARLTAAAIAGNQKALDALEVLNSF